MTQNSQDKQTLVHSQAEPRKAKAETSFHEAIVIPITMAYAEGGYTAPIYVGSEKRLVNVLLDTGSSALAVRADKVLPDQDAHLKPTPLAQAIAYGAGGWAGPVVHSQIGIGHDDEQVVLDDVALALIVEEPQRNFFEADGIWGLAYAPLDTVHDMSDYLQQQGSDIAHTYPWPFNAVADHNELKSFQKLFKQYPTVHITPYFTAMEEDGRCSNKFALYTQRAFYHMTEADEAESELLHDPLNTGFLILGGGEEHTHLYHGELEAVSVVHDVYYNTRIKKFQVDGFAAMDVERIQPKYEKSYQSNSIFDCGSSFMVLTDPMYQYFTDCLSKLEPGLLDLVAAGQKAARQLTGLPMSKLHLPHWPDLHFVMEGEYGDVTLTCPATHYWQINAPGEGEAMFTVISQLDGWANQSILGLPLLSNYFCVFDRSEHELGVIRTAKRK
ncbi:peptidase A1 pepsin [Corallincola holothuriorum]|uniref:Peptidase A1 pepsin n=1 Tax=Corallincola holothuriorum TaxID=2282215 RepID=A0A368NT36_9GAMM|nr:pepsin-like aspartic protease [Corallincola holothuriorum]RCU52884.1 peptidase A1 pepsin [Corallincola holothuriorum]